MQLRDLVGVGGEVAVEAREPVTIATTLDALEASFPELRGTIRDRATGERRAYVRYYSCGRDLSHDPSETPLPRDVVEGRDHFRVLGAISGG